MSFKQSILAKVYLLRKADALLGNRVHPRGLPELTKRSWMPLATKRFDNFNNVAGLPSFKFGLAASTKML